MNINHYYKYDFEPISKNLNSSEIKLSELENIRYIENPKYFHKETAYKKKIDGKISYYYYFSKIKPVKASLGTRYLTHGLDFYKGNFHAQMIRSLINYCNLPPKSIILDPFCGSGTTLIEANLLEFNAIGIDINPIASLNSYIKTKLLDVPLNYLISHNQKYFDLNYFNTKNFKKFKFNEILEINIKELFYLFIYSRAISDETYILKNRFESFKDNYKIIIDILRNYQVLKKQLKLSIGKTKIIHGDNLFHLKLMKENIIDCIITSPPYLEVIDYISNDINQIKYFINEREINQLRNESYEQKFESYRITENNYWLKMVKFLQEAFRILKSNSHLIIIVGFYRKMHENLSRLAKEAGFLMERIIKRQFFNFKGKENHDFILFFKKL